MKSLFKIPVIVLIAVVFAYGQMTGSTATTGYNTGKTSLTIPVKVWGEVTRPGIYDIPIGSDMLAVMSYAGGPTNMAKLTSVRLIRTKTQDEADKIMYVVDIERYLETGDKSMLPEIRLGDTIIVAPRFMKSITTSMGYIQSILSIINVIVLVNYYSGKP